MEIESSIIAAVKVQKVYRSYRTRRILADSALVAEQLWWQAINFAELNHSTISFYEFSKPETAASRWNRITLNAAKVGKGLSKDEKAQKLAFQHWIEAIDPRHRYGHFLHIYYDEWFRTNAGEPFFYWLDVGEGKKVDLKDCPRLMLHQQCIKYLGPQERQYYEYTVEEGKLVHKQSGDVLDTTKGKPGAKWIFVMSTSKKLYCGQKKKGVFHHSSFLAGGATIAAGRLEVKDGVLQSLSPYSGHYRPTDDCFDRFLSFLKENGLNLDEVDIRNAKDGYENYEEIKASTNEISVKAVELSINLESSQSYTSMKTEEAAFSELTRSPKSEKNNTCKRTMLGGLKSPRADVAKEVILERINSKNAVSSYQLGHQLQRKWSMGAGSKISCVNDYPVELRLQALEFVNVSPKSRFQTSHVQDFEFNHSISSI